MLRNIKEEFEDNNLILRQMREDVSRLAATSTTAAQVMQRGRETGLVSPTQPGFAIAMEELDQHRQQILSQIEGIGTSRGPSHRSLEPEPPSPGRIQIGSLNIAMHLDRLRQFIKDQHTYESARWTQAACVPLLLA